MKTKEEIREEDLMMVYGGGYCYHSVLSGESLDQISRELGISKGTLVSLNGIRNPDLIYTGMKLKYPC